MRNAAGLFALDLALAGCGGPLSASTARGTASPGRPVGVEIARDGTDQIGNRIWRVSAAAPAR